MSDWQERITRETAPAIRAEHELRYMISAPLVLPEGPWVDLGCGNGVAAHAAFGECPRMRAVLVDLDEAAVARATRELALPGATGIAADLTSTSDLERIGDAVASLGTPPVVTCFEVVEHLETFLPLLEWIRGLVAEHDATFLMSVPNDAFWSIQNPHHTTSWGEGAFEELRGLLPADTTLLRQVSLSGSAIAPWEERTERHAIEVEVDGAVAVASHFIAAFGPRAAEVRGAAGLSRPTFSPSGRGSASARARWPSRSSWSASRPRSCSGATSGSRNGAPTSTSSSASWASRCRA